ncbi:MAG TPA: 16S rRNA (cytidine(1402)-2'-O)-methyltransferase [Thermoanaerobaculia bacterium]|nr:16S rRNA (cytidine(1402)-2'-O)-methyltransferase [Thermoanaerobaculia bacterium]
MNARRRPVRSPRLRNKTAARPATGAAAPPETPSDATASTDDSRGDRPRGRLLVVATPIGNLGDLAPRARDALAAADLVACEDTRRTGQLLAGLGFKKPLLSLHEHNERQRLPRLLAALDAGSVVALASDAGTPLLSDPGFLLVRAAAARGIAVEPLPGPSALLAALVVSGLPPYPFTFAGFVPPRSGRRRAFYRAWAALAHTLVVFESPHRLVASLGDAVAELGDRPAAVARELTKLHEEVVRAPLSEQLRIWRERPSVKGELVVVIGAGDEAGAARAGEARPAGEVGETGTAGEAGGAVDQPTSSEGRRLLGEINQAYKEPLDSSEQAWLKAARRRHRALVQGQW